MRAISSKLSKYLFAIVMFAAIFQGCTSQEFSTMDKDMYFTNDDLVVVSCPSNLFFYINDIECVTPCNVTVSDNVTFITVSYEDKVAHVPVTRSGFHKGKVYGTLIISNPSRLGENGDSPYAPYFIRDSKLGLTSICAPK